MHTLFDDNLASDIYFFYYGFSNAFSFIKSDFIYFYVPYGENNNHIVYFPASFNL